MSRRSDRARSAKANRWYVYSWNSLTLKVDVKAAELSRSAADKFVATLQRLTEKPYQKARDRRSLAKRMHAPLIPKPKPEETHEPDGLAATEPQKAE